LTRKESTREPGAHPVVKGLVWFTDGSRMKEGTGTGVCGRSSGRRLSIFLGKYAAVLQTEVYAILACVHDNQMNARPEKYVSICSDSQAALKALQGAKTTSPSVQQCRKALNYISTRHFVGLFWVPGRSAVQYKEMNLPTSSHERVLFASLLDQTRPWGSLGRI
jgi:hypothetical protein